LLEWDQFFATPHTQVVLHTFTLSLSRDDPMRGVATRTVSLSLSERAMDYLANGERLSHDSLWLEEEA